MAISYKALIQYKWMGKYNLIRKHNWLKKEEAGLDSLFNLCEDDEKLSLIINLLDRIEYLSTARVDTCLNQVVNQIINVWHLPQEETQIVAATFDTEADSSQWVLQSLKPIFAKHGWDNVKTVNVLSKSVPHLPTHPNVILVDEFVGTGNNISNRVRDIKKRYDDSIRNKSLSIEYNLKVCVLAGITDAISTLEKLGIDIYSCIQIKKGISGYFSGSALTDATKQMLDLEALLLPNHNGRDLPSFGWGSAEALYKMDGGNCPNSVFPIFWWKYLLNGSMRKTILHRLEST